MIHLKRIAFGLVAVALFAALVLGLMWLIARWPTLVLFVWGAAFVYLAGCVVVGMLGNRT